MSSYEANLHAMQTGVRMMSQINRNEIDPIHLRVGVNSAMVSDAALVELLIAKGLITKEEFLAELEKESEREKTRYTELVREAFGMDSITLG